MSSLEPDRAGHEQIQPGGKALNRKSSGELDLSLCTFNYTRPDGLQSPESWGEAHVKTRKRLGEGKDHLHLWGQREVNSADTLQEPQAAVNHSTVFWLTCSGKKLSVSSRLTTLTLHGFTARVLEHVCIFPQEGKPSLRFQFVEKPQLS